MIAVRSFKSLLTAGHEVIGFRSVCCTEFLLHEVIVGWEKQVDGYQSVMSNAVILARPRARLLQQWLDDLPMVFEPQCYTCHSVSYLPSLVAKSPSSWVKVSFLLYA